MGKDKLRRFRENLGFECFVQPEFDEVFRRDHPLLAGVPPTDWTQPNFDLAPVFVPGGEGLDVAGT